MKKAIIGGLFVVVIIVTMTGIAPSCKHETLNLAQFDTVCFERDIMPVFQHGCTVGGCHATQGEGMDLTKYDGIKRGIPSKIPSQSSIYQAITSTMNQPMPPGHALAESDRILIRIWIEQGANQTRCLAEPQVSPINKGGRK
jgi:uncharacterized membrane protein